MTPPDFLAGHLAAAGFFARARDVSVEGGQDAWVLRGTSDRRWTYAGGDVARVLAMLRRDDTHFAAVSLELADALTTHADATDIATRRPPAPATREPRDGAAAARETGVLADDARHATVGQEPGRPPEPNLAARAQAKPASTASRVVWRRDARTFTLPPEVTLPPGPFAVCALTGADAPRIDEHWEHRDDVSLAYIRECVQRDPALGVRVEGELVGWELVHDDGAMGAAFVLPAWRRKGVMRSLQRGMVEALRARGLPVFKHVSLDNGAWLPAQEAAGWRRVADSCWLEVRRD
ncbi:MAG: GNAT family N-acetyltransferase [Myxococcota bacterium]